MEPPEQDLAQQLEKLQKQQTQLMQQHAQNYEKNMQQKTIELWNLYCKDKNVKQQKVSAKRFIKETKQRMNWMQEQQEHQKLQE